ncbi:NUDIX hydrolase [Candidatus Kaiserbacteria bacterium]|nr:NUDIX hydrolase [Candidatus Kaiserbacteria bacterium]
MTLGAFCVIRDNNHRVLLCHRRDKDMWNLPGGKVEKGESPWDAAVREAREEIGLSVTIHSLIGCYFKPSVNDLVFMFTAIPSDNQLPHISDEADEVRYFSLDALPDTTAPKQRERLSQCFLPDVSWPILQIQ